MTCKVDIALGCTRVSESRRQGGNGVPAARNAAGLPSLVGRILDGRYEVEERIQRRQSGDVYRAVDRTANIRFRIEILDHAVAARKPYIRELLHRLRAAARMTSHPIAPVHAFGLSDDGYVFVATEEPNGRTLAQLHRNGDLLSRTRTLRILIGICRLLEEAEARNALGAGIDADSVWLEETEDGEFLRVVQLHGALPNEESEGENHVGAAAARSVLTLLLQMLTGSGQELCHEAVNGTRSTNDERSWTIDVGLLVPGAAGRILTGILRPDGRAAPSHSMEEVRDVLERALEAHTEHKARRRTANESWHR